MGDAVVLCGESSLASLSSLSVIGQSVSMNLTSVPEPVNASSTLSVGDAVSGSPLSLTDAVTVQGDCSVSGSSVFGPLPSVSLAVVSGALISVAGPLYVNGMISTNLDCFVQRSTEFIGQWSLGKQSA